MVLQWSCGLTGEWAQMTSYHYIKVMTGVGNGGGPVLFWANKNVENDITFDFLWPLSQLREERL